MDSFTTCSGVAAAILLDNIDTDAIIPSREMKLVSKTGLSAGLFATWRYTLPGSRYENSEFILNQPDYVNTSILLAGANFGCGSVSRACGVGAEGIRCVCHYSSFLWQYFLSQLHS